jgi:SAM-dependent methyltransferase
LNAGTARRRGATPDGDAAADNRTMSGAPDFSPFAGEYVRARPRYPSELFAWLAAQVAPRRLAWDAGTGNGQAAVALAEHFPRIVATDHSCEQLRHAASHPLVEYRQVRVERSGLEAGSVDLVTAAAAVHWFDVPAFAAEVRRVVRPGGLLAVWSYRPDRVGPPFDQLIRDFYRHVLAPIAAPQLAHLDADYALLDLPGEPVLAPRFEVAGDWDLAQLRHFISTWSSSQAYIGERGRHPADEIAGELTALWGDPAARRTVRWPLSLRAQRR